MAHARVSRVNHPARAHRRLLVGFLLGALLLPASAAHAQRVKLAVWGDSRENLGGAVEHITSILLKDVTDWDAVLHAGDFTHAGSADDWKRSLAFPGIAQLFQAGKFLMCTSNHDDNLATWNAYTRGVLPTNDADRTTHFYAWKKGNVHVIVLDGFFAAADVQQRWLDAYLAKVPPTDWIVAMWHDPSYAKITYKGAFKKARPWLDSLYAHGATLVVNGHAHVYVRTKPLTPGGLLDPRRGIVHVVNGAGGASWKDPQPMTAMTAFTPATKSFPCITFLTFDGDRLHLETIDARPDRRREVIDRWDTTHRLPAGEPAR
jgi:predicted phosphodiesterase